MMDRTNEQKPRVECARCGREPTHPTLTSVAAELQRREVKGASEVVFHLPHSGRILLTLDESPPGT